MSKRIIMAAGGTGGHLSPALAVAQELVRKKHKVILFTDERCRNYLPKKTDFEIVILKQRQLRKDALGLYLFCFSVVKNFFLISTKLISFRANLVVSFGGYSSIAANMAAIFSFTKLYIHEQNSVMGKQNRFFAKFAKKTLLAFPNTKYSENIRNKEVVGIPVRVGFEARSKKSKKFTILIIGGSQGAKFFGDVLPDILVKLKNINIIQQVRKEQVKEVESKYKSKKIEYEIKPYFSDMDKKFSEADLIISRSGAATISEIIAAQKPSILIPYKYAADNHQLTNAAYLSDNGASVIFEESDFDNKKFQKIIEEIINNKKTREKMESGAIRLQDFVELDRFIKQI